MRSTVVELENAVRVFSQLSAASNLHFHGFDEKKIDTHVCYCKHLLEAAGVHLKAAEHEEQQIRQRQELARQVAFAEDARRKADEQRKFQVQSCFLSLLYLTFFQKRELVIVSDEFLSDIIC